MNWNYDLIESLATGVALLLGTLTFAIGYRANRKQEKLARTFEFIRTIYEEEGDIRDASQEAADWLRTGAIHKEASQWTEEEKETLAILLNYLDFIADAANRRIVDHEMIVSNLGGKMRSIRRSVPWYIEEIREALDRPGIFKPLDDFLAEFVGDREV